MTARAAGSAVCCYLYSRRSVRCRELIRSRARPMGPRDSLARSCACSLSAHRGRFPRNGRTLSVVNPMGPRWGQGRALVDPSRPIRRRWAVATGPNGVVAQCVPSEKRKVVRSIPALATRICAGQRLFWWCWGRWRSRVSAKIRRRLSVRRRGQYRETDLCGRNRRPSADARVTYHAPCPSKRPAACVVCGLPTSKEPFHRAPQR